MIENFWRGLQFVMQHDPVLGWFYVVIMSIAFVYLIWEIVS